MGRQVLKLPDKVHAEPALASDSRTETPVSAKMPG